MTHLTRRRLLAALGATPGTVALAGCLSDPPGSGGNGNGPTVVSPPPDDEFPTECPAYDRVERVVCYDQIDPNEADGYLEPSTREVAGGEPIEFTLRNRSNRTLQTNFYNWILHRYVDGEWFHVAPQGWNDPLMQVEPGGSHTWTLTIEDADVEAGEPVAPSGGTEELTVSGVGGGYYAFRGRGWFEDSSHEDAIAFAVIFEYDGVPLELTSSTAIEETEWDGETLVAQSSRGDPDGGYSGRGAFVLERMDDGRYDSKTLIVEQVVRNEQLRDVLALAHEHDADRVRLEEYNSTSPVFGSHTDTRFAFQGASYQIETYELDEE